MKRVFQISIFVDLLMIIFHLKEIVRKGSNLKIL